MRNIKNNLFISRKAVMVYGFFYSFLIFMLLGCGSDQDDFSPNNLISIPKDDKANAVEYGDASIIDISIPDGDYSYKEPMYITATFTQHIFVVSGTPQLELNVDGSTVFADYVSGSGSEFLVFKYLPEYGEDDNTGVDVVSPFKINGATLKDRADQIPQINFTAKNFPNALVDTTLPIVAFNAQGSINYHNQNAYNISGTCSENGFAVDIDLGGITSSTPCVGGGFSFSLNASSLSESADYKVADITMVATHYDLAGNFTPSAPLLLIKDTIRPTISTSNIITPGMKIIGNNIDLSISFNEEVFGTGGNSRIKLVFSDSEKTPGATYASYFSGNGTNTFVYRYTIPIGEAGNGDEDTDGIATATSLDLNSASLVDYNGNTLLTTLPTTSYPTTFVDGIRPTVTSVSSNTPSYNTFYIGQTMTVSINFDDVVNIIGATPSLSFDTFNVLWNPTPVLTYTSGDGTASLVFNHTFVNGNQDNNGLTIGGNIQSNSLADVNGNIANGSLTTASWPSLKVDALIPVITKPALPDVIIANVNSYTLSGTCSEYLHSEVVSVNVTDRLGGTLNFNIPCVSGSFSQTVDLSSLADSLTPTTDDLVFTYNHTDRGGISAPTLTETIRKDTVAPTISSNNSSNSGTRICSQSVRFNVNFSEIVQGANTSRLKLTFSDSEKIPNSTYATYSLGEGTTQYRFMYTIPVGYLGNGDEDIDGVDHAGSIDLQSGTITDVNGNPLASNTLPTTNYPSLFIDGIRPSITTVTSNTPAYDTFYIGQEMQLSVVFDDTVVISGANPYINFNTFNILWTPTPSLTYLSGGATDTLIFSHTFSNGYQDNNGLTVGTSIQLNTIRDINGNVVNRTLTTNSFPTLKVDALIPVVTISSTPTINNANKSSYTLAGTCSEFNFGETVDILFTDRNTNNLTFNIPCSGGTYSQVVDLSSLSDSLTTTTSDILISVNHSDKGGHNAPTVNASIRKDTVNPSIISNTIQTLNYTNKIGDIINLEINYNEVVSSTDGSAELIFDTMTGVTPNASFVTGTNNTNQHSYRYTIIQNEEDTNGINFTGPLVGTTLTDVNGNTTTGLTLPTTFFSTVKVDGIIPIVVINPVSTINIGNVAAYNISGTCTLGDGNVSYVFSSPAGGTDVTGLVSCSGGTWTTGPISLSSLNDHSTIRFNANQTDAAGNIGYATQLTALKDTVYPVVVITTPIPVNGSNKNSFSFAGTCTNGDGNVSYTVSSPSGGSDVVGSTICSAGTWNTGGLNLSGLSDDLAVTIDATQTDAALNTGNATQKTVLKDIVLPIVSINPVTTVSLSNVASYTLTGTCTTGDGSVSYIVSSPSGGTNKAGSFVCASGSWTTGPLSLSLVNDHISVKFNANQTDSAGNTGAAIELNAIKDTVAPNVSINSLSPINNTNKSAYTVSGTCTSGDGGVSYTISSPAGGADVSGTTACSGSTWTTGAINLAGLNDHSAITFNAYQTDASGNLGAATQKTILKDIVLPIVAINAVSTINNSNKSTYTVSGTCSSGDGNISYTISSPAGGTDVTGSVPCSSGSWTSGSKNLSGLSDHLGVTFNASQTDSASNTGYAVELTAIKDTVDPLISINAVGFINMANVGSYSVSGTCTNGDGNISYTISSPAGGTNATGSVSCVGSSWTTGSIDLSSLNDHAAVTFNANQTDSNGNTGSATQRTAIKDVVVPSLSINNPSTINYSNRLNYTFTGTCTNGDGNVFYSISSPGGGSDITGSVSCSGGIFSSGSKNVSGLVDHSAVTFNASQTDAVSNTGYATQKTAIKDTSIPLVGINLPTTISNANKTNYSFSGTCSFGDGNISYIITSPAGGIDVSGSVACNVGGLFSVSALNVTGPNDHPAITFNASQTDSNGNTGSAPEITAIKDTANPVVVISAVATIYSLNVTAYTVNGTCTNGDGNVSYVISSPAGGADKIGSVACSSGTWTTGALDLTSLNDHSAITFNANQTDASGNLGSATQKTAIKDIVLPVVTIDPVNTINNTNKAAYTITGTCTNGDGNVSYTISSPAGGTNITGSLICSGGIWTSGSKNLTSLNDHLAVTFNATQTDANGNLGAATELAAIKDTQLPVVSINALATINNANKLSYTVTGTCSNGDGNVSYVISSPAGGTDVSSLVACSGTTWTTGPIDLSGLNDHSGITFNATQTDSNSNLGSATQKTAIKDTTNPVLSINAVPTINNNNVGIYTVTGTCTNGDGNISYTISSPAGGTNSLGSVSCSAGIWTSGSISLANLNDHVAVTFNATQTDSSGNLGSATQLSAIKDTTAPILTIDAVTTISLANVSSYTVTGSCTNSDGNVSYTIASPAGGASSTGSVTCSGSTWTTGALNLSSLNDHSAVTFNANQTDSNGNLGAATELSAIKDTTSPVLTINAVSTINNSNVGNYTVTGACSNGDGNISYTIASPAGGTDVTSSVTCSGTTWTTGSISLAGLNDHSAITFNATQTDASGNTGSATGLTAIKDTVAPILTITAPVTITNSNVGSYTVSGTCTNGDGNISYTISSPAGGTDVTSSVICSGTTWTTGSISLSSLNDHTAITFNATQTDSNGNTGSAIELTAIKDTSLPVVTINAVSIINNSNKGSYTVTGTCSNGDGNISYTISSPAGGTDVSSSVACSGTTWTTGSISLSGLNDHAAITFNATQTDSNGNTGSATQKTAIKDTSLPVVAINAVSIINASNVGNYTVTGTCSNGDGNISYTISSPAGGTDVTSSVTCSGTTWTTGSISLASLNDHTAITFNATQTDANGNTGSAAEITEIKDTSAPVLSINAVSAINNSNKSSYSMTGICSNGDGNVSYTISSPAGGTDVSSSVSCSGTTWTTGPIDLSGLNDHTAITFNATQTDSNGNTGSATQKTAIKDTSLPVLTINAVSTVNNSNVGSYTVTGTCSNGDGNVSYTISSPAGGSDVSGSVLCSGTTWTTGSISLSSLNDHSAITFDATQTDSNGNTGSATQKTAMKDILAPVVSINTVTTINNSNKASYSVMGTCTSGDGNVTYIISSPAGGADVTSSVTCSGSTWTSGTVDLSGLNDHASISFNANQTDSYSNIGSASPVSALKETVAPTISSVTTSGTGTYLNGETLDFTINFSETVTISAGTKIDINAGGSSVEALCTGTTGSSTTCTYTVGAEIDNDGIDLNSNFNLGAGSIEDANGNNIISLTYSLPDTSTILINSSGLPGFEWEESASVVTNYDYGDPNTNVTVTFTVKNIGNGPTSGAGFLVSISNDGGGIYSITTDNCSGLVIPANDSCTVNIQYQDIGGAGLKVGEGSISDTGASTKTISLTGTN